MLIEPRRLWPNQRYEVASERGAPLHQVSRAGRRRWAAVVREADGWSYGAHPLRVPAAGAAAGAAAAARCGVAPTPATAVMRSWMERHPLPNRLVFGAANPADLGWLVLE